MNEPTAGRLRTPPSRRPVLLLAVAAAALLAVMIVARLLPHPIAAAGTLGECHFGSPVVLFEKGAWEAAAPDDVRDYLSYEIPVLAWPPGTHFDPDTRTLLDAQSTVLVRHGDAVRLTGTVVDMRGGDIPPCFSPFGVRIETIEAT